MIDRRAVFWDLLLIASVIAASVSLLTTGLGLAKYLPFLLAWSLAIAVQMGLFGLAWLIAVGRRRVRALVIGLYAVTMPFSVVFSYVMLQSELTAEIRTSETRRSLFDDLRERTSSAAAEIERSRSEAEDLRLRLDSWVAMEKASGWTSSTCDESAHCYLAEVCERVRGKIASWENQTGVAYRHGPGQALVHGLLEGEATAVAGIAERLGAARADWTSTAAVSEEGLTNRERLRRYDLALANLPRRDLEAVRCEAVVIPPAPSYEEFARDGIGAEEQPVYAFQDLARIFDPAVDLGRSDYPTVFAFFLALFIDLFVLVVAIGAAVLRLHGPERGQYPVVDPVPPGWGEALRHDITTWIDGARLGAPEAPADRREFLASVLDRLRFESDSRAVLVPADAIESRFGHLMARSRAAKAAPISVGDRESVGFVLEDWVYPALTRYLLPETG